MTLLSLFRRCLGADYKHTYEDGDYAIEKTGNTLYLFFQWSHGGRDWENNLDFPAKPYRRMDEVWLCHRGFLRVWRAMRDDIEASVAGKIAKDHIITDIIASGFSHGAALSVFATEDMAFLYGDRLRVRGCGFGCPRVLWGKVPAAVDKRLGAFLVVRNVPDIVTYVPPAVLGYRHAGSLLEIGIGKKQSPVGAHRPEAYIDSLKSMGDLI